MRIVYSLFALIASCLLSDNVMSVGIYESPMSQFPAYGVPQITGMAGQFPNTEERQAHVWYNFVRQAPIFFRDNYIKPFMGTGDTSANNILTSATYSGTRLPVPFNLNFARCARAHITDRLTTSPCSNTNPHNDCNGTSTGTRISKFYTGRGWGEIWSGPFPNPKPGLYPFAGIAAFVCDGTYWFTSTYVKMNNCAGDGSGSDGHRNIIYNQNGEVGCGIQNIGGNSDYSCNQGPVKMSTYQTQIYSGAHVYVPPASTAYYYMANFAGASGASPSYASVIVDGIAKPLTLAAGTNSNGVYRTAAINVTAGELCHSYKFVFTVNGVNETYPRQGQFKTNFIGNCTTDWAL